MAARTGSQHRPSPPRGSRVVGQTDHANDSEPIPCIERILILLFVLSDLKLARWGELSGRYALVIPDAVLQPRV
jgi:hypothetical protein